MKKFFSTLLFAILLSAGCQTEGLTAEEAQESLDETKISAQTEALVTNGIEIATGFTIGQGVQQAAEEIRNFITSQLPCAQVELEGSTLTITYGVHEGNCIFRGHTFSGSHAITVTSNEPGTVQVDHEWTRFSNGIVEVSGNATVTWDSQAMTRHVTHTLNWTRLADARTGTGTGDRLQQALPEGLATGFQVDGSRTWTTARGQWSLEIEAVQMRWQDPVPQAGRYTLQTPFGKEVAITFTRLDDDTIRVTIAGPRRSFHFDVTRTG